MLGMTFVRSKITFSFMMFFLSINVNALEPLKVKFATDANYFPFEYLDQQQTIQGFDIDIAKAVCEEVNLQCSFEHHRFDDLLLMLSFRTYDAVIAALDITDERLAMVDFSDSYYKEPPVFISKEQLQGKLSLEGKFIGVQSNTSNQNYLVKTLANKNSYIIPYFSSKAALEDLKGQKIDAVFADFAVVNQFLNEQKDQSKLVISRTERVFVEQFSKGYGIAVKKGNNILRKRLNEGLKKIVENGTYANIYQKYFP